MGENYFFVYGKELEEVAWGEVYPKKDGRDGYAVSASIEERGEGDERGELLHGVSVTFKRNVNKN